MAAPVCILCDRSARQIPDHPTPKYASLRFCRVGVRKDFVCYQCIAEGVTQCALLCAAMRGEDDGTKDA